MGKENNTSAICRTNIWDFILHKHQNHPFSRFSSDDRWVWCANVNFWVKIIIQLTNQMGTQKKKDKRKKIDKIGLSCFKSDDNLLFGCSWPIQRMCSILISKWDSVFAIVFAMESERKYIRIHLIVYSVRFV